MLEKLLELSKNKELNYPQNRIISELSYAYVLSKTKDGCFDELLNNVEQFLLNAYERDGSITKVVMLEAERLMKSLVPLAKSYEIICAAHAHIDMNWLWGMDETVSVTLDTFRTMLDIMNQYPDFKFSQSQASVYKIVEKHDPDMLEEIKQRVKEGRWEITASTWVEADKNMPNGESQARHILYAKKYLSKLFNLDLGCFNIDFEPDTFGHSLNVPEILSQGGVKYYYHSRGYEGEHNLYRWIAPSGAEIIVNCEQYWYSSAIEPSMACLVPELCEKNGLKTALKVYGVGDHGGGPTRRDIERIIDMNSWPIFPQLKFGTFGEYFSKVEAVREELSVVKGELNFIFDGCYTSQSRIKAGNRNSEVLLNEAELFSSISSLCTASAYPQKTFEDSWRKVLFNQFHDILPGSGIIETREYASGLYQDVLASAKTKRKLAFKNIADKIDTFSLVPEHEDISETLSEGAGAGSSQCGRGAGKTRVFHVFNPSLYCRKEITEFIVWDWTGDMDRLLFKDENNTVLHQVIGKGFNEYWGHNYFKVLLETEVPAGGYSTYTMTEDSNHSIKLPSFQEVRVQKADEFVLSNELISVTFNAQEGSICSIIDKATGKELISSQKTTAYFRLIDEAERKGVTNNNPGMSAWIIGRYKNIEQLNKNLEMTIVHGTLRSTLTYETNFRDSKLIVDISLDKGSTHLSFDVKCDWHEIGRPGTGIPQLSFYLPLPYEAATYKFDIPFGVIDRDSAEIDLPGNSFVMAKSNKEKALMLVTDTKYGFRCHKDSMSITLLRSSYGPDPYPELGWHKFKFALKVTEDLKSNKELVNLAFDYNHPLIVIAGTGHKGVLTLKKNFISLESGSAVVSCVKMPESGDKNKLVLRVYETDGVNTRTVIRFFKQPVNAYAVDLNENSLGLTDAEVKIEKDKITFEVKAYKVLTVIVEF